MIDGFAKPLAQVYLNFLSTIDWRDPLLLAGLNEGRGKFLSNAYLHLCGGIRNKYLAGDYYSNDAIEILRSSKTGRLEFEHMVPKGRYIQKPCEDRASKQQLTTAFIEDRLMKYWHIAIITRDERARLLPNTMPTNWDGSDRYARFKASREPIDLRPRREVVLELGSRFGKIAF